MSPPCRDAVVSELVAHARPGCFHAEDARRFNVTRACASNSPPHRKWRSFPGKFRHPARFFSSRSASRFLAMATVSFSISVASHRRPRALQTAGTVPPPA